jgi:hypothetical protein
VTQTALGGPEVDTSDALATLAAMAHLARDTRSVVHVVCKRAPGIADRARLLGIQADLNVAIDFLPATIRVRFCPKTAL